MKKIKITYNIKSFLGPQDRSKKSKYEIILDNNLNFGASNAGKWWKKNRIQKEYATTIQSPIAPTTAIQSSVFTATTDRTIK